MVVNYGRKQQLWAYRGLIRRLAVRHIRARYSHSVLGLYWALVNPLLTACVLSIVFGLMLNLTRPEAPAVLFIFSGLILWNLFSNSTSDALTSVTDYAMLLAKVRFPREVLPLSSVVARSLDFMFSLIVLVLFMIVFRIRITPAVLWVIPIVTILLLLSTGVALLVSALNTVYRDIGQITGLVLLLWFYLTPVVYSLDQVAEPYRSWLLANPLASLTFASFHEKQERQLLTAMRLQQPQG